MCYLPAIQNVNVMYAEDQNVQYKEYTFQYYDVKKWDTSKMWSILYQCAGEKFPYTFLMIELCLFAPYSNEIVERLFSFRKVKGTLMQIWKSSYMFVFIQKWYPENSAFLFLWILELYIRKVYKMFIYKHRETIEYFKN